MSREEFETVLNQNSETIEQIRISAYDLHKSVGQTYGDSLPYGYHLDMVADAVRRYGHAVVASAADVLPILFAAYYHDSIEDARYSYNDVKRTALRWMDDAQALMAAEIVYALTNDKGRTRAERAGEHYYAGIRQTPYAPLVKFCDRLSNIAHSCCYPSAQSSKMKQQYGLEQEHFIHSISPTATDDLRLTIPADALLEMDKYLK